MDTQEKTLGQGEAIEKFRSLARDVNICMFTTIDGEGGLTSRPMYTSSIDDDGNVWFFTNEFSEKISELSRDNVVHLVYSHPGKNIYLDVKGTCCLVIDRKKMEELWEPSLKNWFPEGLEDARLCLVKVSTESAHFWSNHSTKMRLLFHMIRSVAKGDKYKESEKGKLNLAPTPQEK